MRVDGNRHSLIANRQIGVVIHPVRRVGDRDCEKDALRVGAEFERATELVFHHGPPDRVLEPSSDLSVVELDPLHGSMIADETGHGESGME